MAWGALAAVGAAVGKKLWDDHSSRKAAKQQYNYQMEMWNANNLYNSPLQQMERLREAGLNPNLVYGNGSATHTATMASAPSVNYKGVSNPMNNMLLQYQAENMQEQNKQIAVNTEVAARQAQILKQDERIKRKEAELFEKYGVRPQDPYYARLFFGAQRPDLPYQVDDANGIRAGVHYEMMNMRRKYKK